MDESGFPRMQKSSHQSTPSATELRTPPSPESQTRQLARDPLNYFLTLTREYGDVVRYRPAPDPAYLVNHPDYVRHILVDNYRNYTKDTYINNKFKNLVGDGLVTSEGQVWRQQRRLMQPAFQHNRIEKLDQPIVEITRARLEKWRAAASRGEPVDIAAEMASLTLSITTKALFGIDLGEEVDEVGRAVTMGGDLLEKPNHPRFRNGLQTVKGIVDRLIAERRRSFVDNGDLLAILINTRDELTGARWDDDQLRDQVLTLLLAGYETTSSALTWTWYLLSQHEAVFERMHAEACQVLGNRLPGYADLASLSYTRNVFQEGMRLYPPAWVLGRRALADDAVGGFRIPAGTIVAISPYTLHRHLDFWENPEQFDPDRFLPERFAGMHRYAYIPFGGGPRLCIGYHFAFLEAQIILAMIAREFYPRLLPGLTIRPQPIFILRPNRNMLMELTTP
jgi:cytochrome P450